MRKFTATAAGIILAGFLSSAAGAQEYLQVVSLESDNGVQGVFTSAGSAENKKDIETDAIKSLFYTLFFSGVDGVNDGKPLVGKPNPGYTNSFFNSTARYAAYVLSVEDAAKPQKIGNAFQGTKRITVRLRQLVNDVKKNTGYEEMEAAVQRTLPKPTIIVVPYKKAGESFDAILQNNYDLRVAVSAVQRGFEDCDIKTIDLQARLDRIKRNAQYEENAGAADSNDKQLLESSGADVYVTVDVMKDVADNGSRISLIMKAYETASGTVWASQDGWTNRFQTDATDVLCSYAIKDNLPEFLDQIVKNYSMPVRASLQISLSGMSMNTIGEALCSDGTRVMTFIQNWLDRNADEGDYHLQGIVDEKAIFDYVMLPNQDKDGYRMTPDKFAGELRQELSDRGISSTYRLEGNVMFLILDL